MFDPTIFENLKVVMEGAVYDLDLQGDIQVVNRNDIVDIAQMSRNFSIDFIKIGGSALARTELSSDVMDFAAEKFSLPTETAGSYLRIGFIVQVTDPAQDCPKISMALKQIWDKRPEISQQITYEYGKDHPKLSNHICLTFGRKINENQIPDIPGVLQHMLRSIDILDGLVGKD